MCNFQTRFRVSSWALHLTHWGRDKDNFTNRDMDVVRKHILGGTQNNSQELFKCTACLFSQEKRVFYIVVLLCKIQNLMIWCINSCYNYVTVMGSYWIGRRLEFALTLCWVILWYWYGCVTVLTPFFWHFRDWTWSFWGPFFLIHQHQNNLLEYQNYQSLQNLIFLHPPGFRTSRTLRWLHPWGKSWTSIELREWITNCIIAST